MLRQAGAALLFTPKKLYLFFSSAAIITAQYKDKGTIILLQALLSEMGKDKELKKNLRHLSLNEQFTFQEKMVLPCCNHTNIPL